jgi:two-component system OmpR family sensor kinase
LNFHVRTAGRARSRKQKQFTADASHELRTPLAVLICEAQTTLARERTAAKCRATIEVCLETAREMRELTESLLQRARLEAGREVLRRENFDLASVIRKCVGRVHPLAEHKGIAIQTTLPASECVGDADRACTGRHEFADQWIQ